MATGAHVNKGEEVSATSLSLLERARGRDPVAWERLVSLYRPLVEHWCERANLQDADMADVRQEVFLAVSRKSADVRRERAGDTFRGWLYTITRHKICDHRRKVRAEQAHLAGSSALKPLAQMPPEEPDDTDSS